MTDRPGVWAVLLVVAAGIGLSGQAPARPTRVNSAIELLSRKQPVYYTHGAGGYDEGKKLAKTPYDYINYEMEHGAFDVTALRAFMQGLVDGGPARSGHRTPAVIATLPVLGLDEPGMRANHWAIHQVLAAGAHGILLCHTRVPEAARVLVETVRYPFAAKVSGLGEGLRGSGSQGYASHIWGISGQEYLQRADVWPLNQNGEILLGVKLEDRHALANAEKTTRVPGIAFAEWGPGDMGFSLVGLPAPDQDRLPEMRAARSRVLQATKASGIFFLNTCTDADVAERLNEGVMICTDGYGVGRKITARQ